MTSNVPTHPSLVARSLSRLVLAALVPGALLVHASATHAAATPEQACQNGRYASAAKYSACEQKVTGKFLAGGDLVKFQDAVSKCRVKYAGTWAKLQAKASGTGATCDNARFDTTSAPGTVIDRLTGLQWEQKTDDAGVHDKDNLYTWNTVVAGTEANGTAYTSFLATLNGGGCFAGQCDWRLPTLAELQTILSEPYPCTTSPCIDEGIFGPTAASSYWSSTTNATNPVLAWHVDFTSGFGYVYVSSFLKSSNFYVRGVRAGL